MQYAVQHLSRKIDDTSVEKMLKKVTWPTLTEDFRRSRNSFKLSMFSKQNESRSHLLNVKKYKLSLEKFSNFQKTFARKWIFNPRKKPWTTSNGGEETTRRVNYGKFTKNPWKLNHHLLSKMSVKCNSTTIKWCAEKQVSCARLFFN